MGKYSKIIYRLFWGFGAWLCVILGFPSPKALIAVICLVIVGWLVAKAIDRLRYRHKNAVLAKHYEELVGHGSKDDAD
jgi:hypothetical protein